MKCPSCGGLTESDDKSCSCGWRAKRYEPKQQPRLCAWNDHGDPCHRTGHLSMGTAGAGPWYCRNHFARLMGWPAWEAAVPGDDLAEVDKRVNKLVPRLTGESERDWSGRCRDWVLSRMKRGVLRRREAGEDEKEAA